MMHSFHSRMKHTRTLLTALLLTSLLCAANATHSTVNTNDKHDRTGEKSRIQAGDYVAMIGDSITEQKLYSLFIEEYLLMCKPVPDLKVTQFGWGGETASSAAARLAHDVLPFAPTVATTCLGMNDGGFGPIDAGRVKRFREGQTSILKQLKGAGVRMIVVGSPGCVDTDYFGIGNGHPEQGTGADYNQVLATLGGVARDLAREEGAAFAEAHEPMMDIMTRGKAKYGNQYMLGPVDGVHPYPSGHLVMAYSFLQALGCDGDIGTITVDRFSGSALASAGHKILSFNAGVVEIESSRYPFCVSGDPSKSESARSMLEFLPFNAELNRLMLVVKGESGNLKVTWGNVSKVFSAVQLATGINLANEFPDNPFCEPFQKVGRAILEKQTMETSLIKKQVHNLPPDRQSAEYQLGIKVLVKQEKEANAKVAAAVEPVRHTLKLESADSKSNHQPQPEAAAPGTGATPRWNAFGNS